MRRRSVQERRATEGNGPVSETYSASVPRTRTWILCGNTSELGNAGREPGESYLFSLTVFNPGIRLTGDRVYGRQKYLMFEISCVIAHEVGHHVQNLTGTFQKIEAGRGRGTQAGSNRMSVQLELQADCYAGVWGHHAGTMNQLDSGDIAEALNAATAIGDDRLQKQTQGRVVPESFTHGSSEQRVRWFKRGVDSGQPKDCDTFSSSSL
jgi:hypothetical protein